MSIVCEKQLTLKVEGGIPEPSFYWKLDDAAAPFENAINPAGRKLIVASGTVVPNQAGKIGQAFRIDDSAAFTAVWYDGELPLHASDDLAYPGTGVSLSTWVKFDGYAPPNKQAFYSCAYEGFSGASITGMYIGYDQTYFGDTFFAICRANFDYLIAQEVGNPISDGNWHFLCVIYDNTTGLLKYRVDNRPWVWNTTDPFPLYGPGVASAIAGPSTNGRLYFQGGNPAYKTVTVTQDETGLWIGRVLTDSEVDQLWNSGSGKTYPFS